MVKHAKTGLLAVIHHHGDMCVCNKINLYIKIMILSHSLVMTKIIYIFVYLSKVGPISIIRYFNFYLATLNSLVELNYSFMSCISDWPITSSKSGLVTHAVELESKKCVEIPFSRINHRIILEKLEVGTGGKV
jgi:hypothetical protein